MVPVIQALCQLLKQLTQRLWHEARQGRRFKHGSSIDHWGDKNISKTEIRSIRMAMVQKPLLLSLSQKHKCETDRYEQLERFHIFVRSRENVECEKKINLGMEIMRRLWLLQWRRILMMTMILVRFCNGRVGGLYGWFVLLGIRRKACLVRLSWA